ncbi:FAD-binding oxidoreductase [Streptococcus merionis]|uniref:NAD(P)/FAD-dependent oxidoreductase n=1 Tax=Streptococcus merionis TaxID=400065 RepID=UPI0026F17EF4|nr:FAD-binding oxidoreductase [Streptococcus merionis]
MEKKHIIIIGGGIVGSTAAYYLSKSLDHRVTLIDDGTGQATRAAAGIICPWFTLKRNKDWYRLTSQGAAFYETFMEDLRKDGLEHLPYKQTGTFVFKKKEEHLRHAVQLADERRVDCPRIGEVTIHTPEEVAQVIPPFASEYGAVFATGGGRLNGTQLVADLRNLFVKNGGTYLQGSASLVDEKTVLFQDEELVADHLILAVGAWLPQLLSPLGYEVDVRPQKGQLIEFETNLQTDDWPVCMPPGEIDLLPFENGRMVIGASHENDMGYDISVDKDIINGLKEKAAAFIPELGNKAISKIRVGTRAYTSDYAPFYGTVSGHDKLWVASGLGSSGLTNGPYIAWQIAQHILGQDPSYDLTPHSPEKYIQKLPKA